MSVRKAVRFAREVKIRTAPPKLGTEPIELSSKRPGGNSVYHFSSLSSLDQDEKPFVSGGGALPMR